MKECPVVPHPTCGVAWYFLRFLQRDGSLTQMYMAFLMVPVTACVSLSTIVKHSKSTGYPVVHLAGLVNGGWDSKMSPMSTSKGPT